MIDNPQLTARLWKGRQPLRIVFDKNLKLPATHRLFDNSATTWVINEEKEEINNDIQYRKLAFNEGLLTELLQQLYNANILSLIVEGGANLLEQFISLGLWDEARIFTSESGLRNGLKAPMITNAIHAAWFNVESDHLDFYTHQDSPWQFINGMEL
jgi:diaminohydroxyphosphoribosylaminopyrimidine deaminase / 5-amino-6-(5-phosphoribosylamino)uracil reductase